MCATLNRIGWLIVNRGMKLSLMILLAFLCVHCTYNTTEESPPPMFDDAPNQYGQAKPKDGWSISGNLTAGDSVKSLNLQVEFPEAGAYTIEFSVVAPSVGSGSGQTNQPIRTEALITWSVEGNQVTRRVSVANGTTISGVAQAVRVQVNDLTGNPGGTAPSPAPNGASYLVAMQVAKGSRPSVNQPPTLTPVTNTDPITILGGATATFTIPRDAGVISAYITAVARTTPAGAYQAITSGKVIVKEGSLAFSRSWDYLDKDGYVPMFPGADFLAITNNFAAGTEIEVTVTYGIDG